MADMWTVDKGFGARPSVDRLTFMFTDGHATTGVTEIGQIDFGSQDDVIRGSRRAFCRAYQYSECEYTNLI